MNLSMKVKEEWVEKGQAVLLVLLVIAIALGFGLSIISQSVSDVRISKQEQEASRAFNAAEAGIEEALKDIAGAGIGGSLLVDGIEVNYGVLSNTYISNSLKENESVEVDLTGADVALNSLSINWVDSNSQGENPDTCVASSGQAPASLLITVTDDSDPPQQASYGVNACALNTDNGMTDVSNVGSSTFLRQYDVAVDANDVLVRIRPIYNRASISVTGNVDLPVQAYVISSTAQAPTLESKAIEVTRTEPATPSIFDYVLFSGTSIVK
jgi:hypothetical protein